MDAKFWNFNVISNAETARIAVFPSPRGIESEATRGATCFCTSSDLQMFPGNSFGDRVDVSKNACLCPARGLRFRSTRRRENSQIRAVSALLMT